MTLSGQRCVAGVPDGGRSGGADTVFEETGAEYFPNLMTTINPESQEAQQDL